MSKRSSHRHARRLGVPGLALATLLSPAGKIIATAVAAAVMVGGVATQFHAPAQRVSPTPNPAAEAPPRFPRASPTSTGRLSIKHGDTELHIMLADNSANVGPYAIPGFSLVGLPGSERPGPGLDALRDLHHGHGTPNPAPPETGTPAPFNSPPGGNPIAGNPAFTPTGGIPITPQPSGRKSPGTPPDPAHPAGPGHPTGTNPSIPPDEQDVPGVPPDGPHNDYPFESDGPHEFQSPPTNLPFQSDASRELSQAIQTNAVSVPEPTPISLMLLGLAAMVWRERRCLARERT